MPNHVLTIIEADADTIKDIIKKFVTEDIDGDTFLDFEKVIPAPRHIYQGSFLGTQEEEMHGKNNCWYEWSIFNWGTKWNSYRNYFTSTTIKFETAWSHPFQIIRELSCVYPDINFIVKFADEDIGRNCGEYEIKNLIRKNGGALAHTECTDVVEILNPVEFARELWDSEDDEEEYSHT